jgi:hypothetical protein
MQHLRPKIIGRAMLLDCLLLGGDCLRLLLLLLQWFLCLLLQPHNDVSLSSSSMAPIVTRRHGCRNY